MSHFRQILEHFVQLLPFEHKSILLFAVFVKPVGQRKDFFIVGGVIGVVDFLL